MKPDQTWSDGSTSRARKDTEGPSAPSSYIPAAAAVATSESPPAGTKLERAISTLKDPPRSCADGLDGSTSMAEIIRELRDTDIILGRGAPAIRNPGNVQLGRIVSWRKGEYKSTRNRRTKDTIAKQVMQAVKNSHGRFVRKIDGPEEMQQYGVSSQEAAWMEVDSATAMVKVKQALRDRDSILLARESIRSSKHERLDRSTERFDCDSEDAPKAKTPRVLPDARHSMAASTVSPPSVVGPVVAEDLGPNTPHAALSLPHDALTTLANAAMEAAEYSTALVPRNTANHTVEAMGCTLVQYRTEQSANHAAVEEDMSRSLSLVHDPTNQSGNSPINSPAVSRLLQAQRLDSFTLAQGLDSYTSPLLHGSMSDSTSLWLQIQGVTRLGELQDAFQRQQPGPNLEQNTNLGACLVSHPALGTGFERFDAGHTNMASLPNGANPRNYMGLNQAGNQFQNHSNLPIGIGTSMGMRLPPYVLPSAHEISLTPLERAILQQHLWCLDRSLGSDIHSLAKNPPRFHDF